MLAWIFKFRDPQCWSIWKVENQACTFLARSDFKKPSSRLASIIGNSANPKTRKNINVELKMQYFSITSLDSLCGMMRLLFDTTITNVKLVTQGRLDVMNAVLISSVVVPTFNAQLGGGEPLTVTIESKLGYDIFVKKVEHDVDTVGKLQHSNCASIWIPPPSQASEQQRLFPQGARTKCVKPVLSRINDQIEGRVKWNELFIFKVPRKASAKLEIEVTNLAAKAGKGEVAGALSFSYWTWCKYSKEDHFFTVHPNWCTKIVPTVRRKFPNPFQSEGITTVYPSPKGIPVTIHLLAFLKEGHRPVAILELGHELLFSNLNSP
ncbi:hypothetical protein VNO77_38975 [Canavalia gladiata]|uniref:Uncharacterized protein n=1 Tax=Canavalia gladiata TaxID=3824 RepID=A0AAN9KCS6_CANGL